MNGDVEISNIVFDNCNVEDKGNTVVQDYSSGCRCDRRSQRRQQI